MSDTTSKPPSDTIQLRTLSNRTGVEIDELRRILRAAGINDTPLYGTSKVNVEAATKAIEEWRAKKNPPPTAAAPSADPVASLRADAAGAPTPLPGPRSLSLEDNPVDETAALDLVEVLGDGAAPAIPNLPDTLIHKWVNRDSARVAYFLDNHWRCPTKRATLMEWDPSGRLANLQGPDGIVAYRELLLMVKPRRIYEAEQAARPSRLADRAQEVLDTFMANIEEAQKTLRDVLHLERPERHISVIRESHEDSIAREQAAATHRAGGRVVKPRAFVGRAAGR